MDVREQARSLILGYSARARQSRGALFRELFEPTADDAILDLGSEEGDHIAAILPFRYNVTIADIDADKLELGRMRHGFRTVLLDETGKLPFPDGHFDIVFCSSVIEHVTLRKSTLGDVTSTTAFAAAAFARQREFADEIRRIAKRYFVQTPNKWFLVESHTWLPLPVVLLPRALQLRFLASLDRWWIKRTNADWNLLTARDMAVLFPDAMIRRERVLGMTKSLMAVRR